MTYKPLPTVFISYSWDSAKHQAWVLQLADTIKAKGATVVVDRTHLPYGGHIKTFMLRSILEADVVLMILTPEYKQKADALSGGAGYEYNIINDQLFNVITTNDKYIPVLRRGDIASSTTEFLRGFNCVDLRDTPEYAQRLNELLNQITSRQRKPTVPPQKIQTNMTITYKDFSLLVKEMETKAHSYFTKLVETENPVFAKIKVKATFQEWESDVEEYHAFIKASFNPDKMQLYADYAEDFKNNIFAKRLWTVDAALRARDPDLARYKSDYRDASAVDIYQTVNGILNATHTYVQNTARHLNYSTVQKIDDLGMHYLDEDKMLMNRIIGYGIRSEILHRYYPAYLPVMTQKSLWAMYFICDSSDEFITIEQKKAKNITRVSHNWQYPYDRFTLLMNTLANQLSGWFGQHGLRMNPQYRFGYVNKFLWTIHGAHKGDIALLHQWTDMD